MTDEEIEGDRLRLIAEQDGMRKKTDPEWRERFAPDTFGHHEALHLASVFGEMIEAHLAEHPAVFLDPKCYVLASRAGWFLEQLYQEIGSHGAYGEQPGDRTPRLA